MGAFGLAGVSAGQSPPEVAQHDGGHQQPEEWADEVAVAPEGAWGGAVKDAVKDATDEVVGCHARVHREATAVGVHPA